MNDLENMWKETVVILFRRSQYLPIGTQYKKRKRRRVGTVLVPRFRTGTAKTCRSSANLSTAKCVDLQNKSCGKIVNEAPRHKSMWRSGGTYPRILHFGTRWR